MKETRLLMYVFEYMHEDDKGDKTPAVAFRVVMVTEKGRVIGDRATTGEVALRNFSSAINPSRLGPSTDWTNLVSRVHYRYPQVVRGRR